MHNEYSNAEDSFSGELSDGSLETRESHGSSHQRSCKFDLKALQSDKLPFLAISAVHESGGWYVSLRATLNNWVNLALDAENRDTVENWTKSQNNACNDSY